ncbi:hypothetical protein LINPERPRIM_LOCUS1991 [Linum perenne]
MIQPTHIPALKSLLLFTGFTPHSIVHTIYSMALWVQIILSFLPLLTAVEAQSTNSINQTDLQIAMADMRAMSYHGFVILLKILDSNPNTLQDGELTFLMPSNEELSGLNQTMDHLQDLILSHSIPSALLLTHLMHLPSGTRIPSGSPNKLLRITNSGRSGLFVNNARITTPNVCLNSMIKCHGVSAAITFDDSDSSPDSSFVTLDLSLDVRSPRWPVSAKSTTDAGSSSSLHLDNIPAPH